MKIWKLKPREERRFRAGHPWVFSNELSESPKGTEPGEWIELRTSSDEFLAYGFGNPASLIAFRKVTTKKIVFETAGDWVYVLNEAFDRRVTLGLSDSSFRWIFSEADGIPGLILDLYRRADRPGVILSGQIQSSGADKNTELLANAILECATQRCPDQPLILILRRDSSSRTRDGLERLDSVIREQGLKVKDLESFTARVGHDTIRANWLNGQKTGLFLDQTYNRERLLLSLPKAKSKLRILDLFCYVGQWSTRLAMHAKQNGIEADFVLVDSSDAALGFAEQNLKTITQNAKTIKLDLLEKYAELQSHGSFDVVISDPPALIKSRKHLNEGVHAYTEYHRRVMGSVAVGGILVVCSCSQLLDREAFVGSVENAIVKNKMQFQWLDFGIQTPDHPVISGFPESQYLKCAILKRLK